MQFNRTYFFLNKNESKFHLRIHSDEIKDINTTFSSDENNCNYTMFKSEFLICCGNIDIIICERRDMDFKLIGSFNLTLKGNIKNLTLENHNDTYVELLYSNETLGDGNIYNIYEYDIYPPKCKNINIIQINNGNSVFK